MPMRELLSVCAYCERDEAQIASENALVFVNIGGTRVLLCLDCRQEKPAMSEDEMWELLNAPIDLPPGITALQHHCPMLEYDGFDKAEATSTLELIPDDDKPGFLYAHCGECGMSVRSPVVVNRAAEPD